MDCIPEIKNHPLTPDCVHVYKLSFFFFFPLSLELLLTPEVVRCKLSRKSQPKFTDIWAGQYTSFAQDSNGNIYAWGLNNYFQLGKSPCHIFCHPFFFCEVLISMLLLFSFHLSLLGLSDMENRFTPEKVESFKCSKEWLDIVGGQHHTVALSSDSKYLLCLFAYQSLRKIFCTFNLSLGISEQPLCNFPNKETSQCYNDLITFWFVAIKWHTVVRKAVLLKCLNLKSNFQTNCILMMCAFAFTSS